MIRAIDVIARFVCRSALSAAIAMFTPPSASSFARTVSATFAAVRDSCRERMVAVMTIPNRIVTTNIAVMSAAPSRVHNRSALCRVDLFTIYRPYFDSPPRGYLKSKLTRKRVQTRLRSYLAPLVSVPIFSRTGFGLVFPSILPTLFSLLEPLFPDPRLLSTAMSLDNVHHRILTRPVALNISIWTGGTSWWLSPIVMVALRAEGLSSVPVGSKMCARRTVPS